MRPAPRWTHFSGTLFLLLLGEFPTEKKQPKYKKPFSTVVIGPLSFFRHGLLLSKMASCFDAYPHAVPHPLKPVRWHAVAYMLRCSHLAQLCVCVCVQYFARAARSCSAKQTGLVLWTAQPTKCPTAVCLADQKESTWSQPSLAQKPPWNQNTIIEVKDSPPPPLLLPKDLWGLAHKRVLCYGEWD